MSHVTKRSPNSYRNTVFAFLVTCISFIAGCGERIALDHPSSSTTSTSASEIPGLTLPTGSVVRKLARVDSIDQTTYLKDAIDKGQQTDWISYLKYAAIYLCRTGNMSFLTPLMPIIAPDIDAGCPKGGALNWNPGQVVMGNNPNTVVRNVSAIWPGGRLDLSGTVVDADTTSYMVSDTGTNRLVMLGNINLANIQDSAANIPTTCGPLQDKVCNTALFVYGGFAQQVPNTLWNPKCNGQANPATECYIPFTGMMNNTSQLLTSFPKAYVFPGRNVTTFDFVPENMLGAGTTLASIMSGLNIQMNPLTTLLDPLVPGKFTYSGMFSTTIVASLIYLYEPPVDVFKIKGTITPMLAMGGPIPFTYYSKHRQINDLNGVNRPADYTLMRDGSGAAINTSDGQIRMIQSVCVIGSPGC